jgi:hypothetical protein
MVKIALKFEYLKCTRIAADAPAVHVGYARQQGGPIAYMNSPRLDQECNCV